ncbi:hypothetical protein HMPREF9333_01605 [Johnsonella ignava ATCC 51276]|uniref:Uncharacterized protein n=3 Tax=Bacillota TaxID=1239 RepID=G5GJ65_9FIRM|nr:hypothetical protein HMPREF9333_01605 [Johnsonella ignava ATCC 51276]
MEHLPVVEGKEKGFLQHRVETTASGVILAKAGRNALYRISSSRKRETNFCGCSFPKKWRTEVRESLQSRRASFYHGAKIRNSAVLPLAGNLLGSAFPKPCFAACAAYPRRAHAARKEVTTMRKKYNTPHRSRVVKTRLSEDEYADFTARLAPYGISQSEFLRQAIRRTTIRPVIHVSAVNDELLSAVGKLAAEYGRIGGNLNQIARYLNEYGAPYNALSGEVRAAIVDLAALKYEVLQKVGDAVGNTQAYQL